MTTNIQDKTKKPKVETYDKPVDNGTFKQDMEELQENATSSLNPPSVSGSNSISGSTPDLESDDDVLQNAHRMGIAPDADFENPTELNIAKDVHDAEKSR